MMAGDHPSESTLLAYLEEELGVADRDDVERHLAGCDACAGDVALAAEGREAVRAAQPVEPPAGLRERALPGLATAEPSPERRRWLKVVVPVAAALALVGGLTTFALTNGPTGGGGGDQGGAAEESSAAEDDLAPADGGGEAAGTATVEDGSKRYSALSRVSADPHALARDLRARGFRAEAKGRRVLVETGRRQALLKALAGYGPGPVTVQVPEGD